MAYRFAGREVAIRREGEVVILEPLKASRWPPGLLKRLKISDAHFKRPVQGGLPLAPDLE